MRSLVLTVLFSFSSIVSAAATPQLYPRDVPAALPHATTIQYSGNGCPSSDPAVSKSGSWNDLTFRMNNYEVSLPGSDSTANCEVHIQAAGCQAGWQVGIKDVYVKGHLVLDPGAVLNFFVTSFWSQDAAKTVTARGTLQNTGTTRLDQITTAHATIPSTLIVWGPCSDAAGDIGILNVNFRTALVADGNQYAYFGKGGDVAATESFGYVWRQC
ncbi:uncharacterized protein BCR38DRAFT_484898 [Pseudomassariella vexata]|uniref:Secreted protein n=1 Tax=Pseudomassariella vexata TaxID=1141098 RepID=A0A1Y2E1Q2_9PEZI|nr:uncharacterized protein BCR38DRAFT_484898 [Pseudomassariella vexata]ORY65481.1 hypothetical protein BCR38DRAFT_484898 [Pseudomassariella vexata]